MCSLCAAHSAVTHFRHPEREREREMGAWEREGEGRDYKVNVCFGEI